MQQKYYVVWVVMKRSYIGQDGRLTTNIDDARLYIDPHLALLDGIDATGAPCQGSEFFIDRVGFRLFNEPQD